MAIALRARRLAWSTNYDFHLYNYMRRSKWFYTDWKSYHFDWKYQSAKGETIGVLLLSFVT